MAPVPFGAGGHGRLSCRFHVSASAALWKLQGFSLSLSYALSQTHNLSMGHWAVAPMGSGCWVAVSGWEWGGEGVGKQDWGGDVQHWRVKVT